MTFRSPLGISDFGKLRSRGCYYADKTRFIAELLDDPIEVVLYPRPRRFGKTLNLSSFRYFLEKTDEDRGWMFEGLEVWADAQAREHFQRYPVILVTFKDVKAASWEACLSAISNVLAELHREHRYLLDAGIPSDLAATFERILHGDASEADLASSLRRLSEMLRIHHGERVAILVDEYDTPVHAGFTYGYFDQVALFFRNFLSGGMKDNPHLFKGVMTGILRIAKEDMFSGLNNVDVRSLLVPEQITAFGFTQQDVDALVDTLSMPEVGKDLKRWYDGYRFLDHVMYNPWSVLQYAQRPQMGPQPYWVSTSSSDVLRSAVLEREHAVARDFERLLAGDAITKVIDQNIVMRDVGRDERALWSLLLMSGYVTTRDMRVIEGEVHADLVIPNEDVRAAFKHSIQSWVESSMGGNRVRMLLDAMLAGDVDVMQEILSDLVRATFSVHDTADRSASGDFPERVYQAFLLGMLILLAPDYEVKSNRESGYGRYDVAVIPRQPGKPGVVLELKRLMRSSNETVDKGLDAALQQIRDRAYAADVEARGASPVLLYGVVFDGKRVWVRMG